MISTWMQKVRWGAVLLVAGFIAHAPLAAQTAEDPGAALTRHLRSLAASPRDVPALLGAGQAALQLGDPQAALTFFARAEEQAPRDGRIKAGIGSAFVALEQPSAALRFFQEATVLGTPAVLLAADRGLAYDLIGQQRLAQNDYRLVLRSREDAEVRRRLALSLAITGERDAALEAIAAQLRQQDRAAWRTRAFVLALTGDPAGAMQVAMTMVPHQAREMQPFFARLPSLTPEQRAMAVHFGHFPGDSVQLAQNLATPQASAPAAQGPATQAGTPDARQAPLGSGAKQPAARAAPARPPAAQPPRSGDGSVPASGPDARFGRSDRSAVVSPAARPGAVRPGADEPQRSQVGPPASGPDARFGRSEPTSRPVTPSASTQSQSRPVRSNPETPKPPVTPAARETRTPSSTAEQAKTEDSEPRPATSSASVAAEPAAGPRPIEEVDVGASITMADASDARTPLALGEEQDLNSSLAEIARAIAELEDPPAPKDADADPPVVRITRLAKPEPPASAKKAVEPKKEDAKAEARKEPKKDAQPKRIWVQIAGSANKAGLPREYDRLKAKAPKLLSGKSAWTTPLRATNRLLVGPFKSEKEAQELVNELNKLEFAAFSWTSPEGQEIEKLPAK